MLSFDLFHESADRSTVTHTRTSGSVSGATALNAEGSTFTLASAPSTAFSVGQRVVLYDGLAGLAFATVKRIVDSTHIVLLPIQSVSDTVTLPYSFPSGSAILVVDEVAAQQIIDLSEAPDDSYDFLVVGQGTLESSGTPGQSDVYMRLQALQDDPLSGVTGYGATKVTLDGTKPDRVNFVSAAKITLAGGNRYENFIGFSGPSTGGVQTSITNPRILALRVTGGYFAGDGKTAVGNTTSTSFVDYLDLGANLPAGQYLIVSTWALGSTAGGYAEAQLEIDGSIVLADEVSQRAATSDYGNGAGFYGVVTLGATNRVRLRYRGFLGFNANIRNAFLAAIPIANIPALAAVHVSQDLATDESRSVSTDAYVIMKTSGSVTLESGRHIEIVSASVGADAPFRSRPSYDAAGTGLGNHNTAFGVNGAAYVPTFFFVRNRRNAGATTNSLQMRRNTAVTTNLKARDFTFSWLREQPDFVAQPDEKIAVIADVELGGRVLKHWNATTTVRRYFHRQTDQRAYSRCRVNSQEYTRVYTLAAMDDGTWFWDPLTFDFYVQLTTTHAGLGAPDSTSVNIVVVPLLLVGTEAFDLVDSRGVWWPYRQLLKSTPSITQSIRSDDAKFAASGQLGSLQLTVAHGEFDDTFFSASPESYRVKIRRGFTRRSMRIDDFEVVGDTVIRDVSSNFETLTLQLLDRRRIMQTPVAKTKITVREGYGTEARARDDQEIGPRWGEQLGVVAYRITANESGGGTYNTYQFADHAVKSVLAVYLDAERTKRVDAATYLDITSTYLNLGQLRMKNSALGSSPLDTQPPNTIFVDLLGRTSNGATSGTALQKHGEIARDLLASNWSVSPATSSGGTPAVRLQERTFRMIDRRWRWQQIAGSARRPVAPRVSFDVSGKTSVEEALTELCARHVAYWFVNHQDRIGLDVPDFDRGNLARNGGGEDDLATVYPWEAMSGGTIALTTARKYAGARSFEVSNGSPVNTLGGASERIALAAGGTHVIFMVASLLEGVPDAFRIGIVGPSGVETLSEAQTVGTGQWSPHTLVYDSEPGDAGHTELRIYPAYGSSTATRVAVDEVSVYRVAAVLDEVNATPISYEFEDEHYVDCDVPYAVNRQDEEHASKRRIGESEARGLSAAIEPEGKFAIQSATRAELSDTRAADGDSAAGLGAPVALYYSRRRPLLTVDAFGLDRIPLVGDYVFVRDLPRVPVSPDGYQIWRISKVTTSDSSGKVVRLEMRRQLDPVADRIDIAPDNIPMGAISPTLTPAAIPDYGEVTDIRNQFLMAATTPDTTTQRGDFVHKHSTSHKHNFAAHAHQVTPTSVGIDGAGAAGQPWPVQYDGRYGYPAPVGPQEPVTVARGLTDGGHSQGTPSADVSGSVSGESSPPNTTLETPPGPNSPSHMLVRCMQRTANTVDTIDANLMVGFLSLPLPAGWTRVVALDGMYLRGAGTLGPMSTTTTATFTPSDAGSTLTLTSGTGAILGRRLTVTKSGSTVHVIVTVENGTTPTVVPLHETGDAANGSFPSGSGATVTADSQLLVKTNVATSPYAPNDAGSTLKVVSATNISVGSLLTVINTADGNKYVHVVVTAVSGTDLTVTPLHLPGDQANSYSPGFPASVNTVVMHSECRAPTHKHGGAIDPHQHAGGGHQHPDAQFVLGAAGNTLSAQKYLGGTSEDIGEAAVDEHTHLAKIRTPGDNTNSGSAGGTITGDLAPVLPFFEVIWAVSDGTQKTIPATGILMWAQSAQAPGGWSTLAAAKDLFVKGAAAGASATSGTGGHAHQQADDAHTFSHAHGGITIQPSEGPDGGSPLIEPKAGAETKSVSAGKTTSGGGHAHLVIATIQGVNPAGGLLANAAHDTGPALNGLPRYKQLLLIQKN